MTSYGCARCGTGFGAFETFVEHAFGHVFRELEIMTDSITELTTEDAAEQASVDALSADVTSMAAEQSALLQDVLNDLKGLGNNDQVSAIAAKIAARKTQLDGIAAQAVQLTADQSAADAQLNAAENPPAPPVVVSDPPVVADGSASAGSAVL